MKEKVLDNPPSLVMLREEANAIKQSFSRRRTIDG